MKRTERQLHLALGKLLDRVRINNSWSAESFMEAAQYVENVTKAEANRFYKALLDLNYVKPSNNKRKMTANFNVNIWKNEDAKISLVIEVLNATPDFVQVRGRRKGTKFPKFAEVAILQAEINSLAKYTALELVEELRSRGYVVTATRQVVHTEEL